MSEGTIPIKIVYSDDIQVIKGMSFNRIRTPWIELFFTKEGDFDGWGHHRSWKEPEYEIAESVKQLVNEALENIDLTPPKET